MNTPTLAEFKSLSCSREWQSAVSAYLMQLALAETIRERIDKVHREILTECPIYVDRDRREGESRQILKSSDLYLCDNDVLCQDFYDEADHRLRKLGLKPAAMTKDNCPALVAESELIKVEWFIINEVAGPHFEVDNNSLLCGGMNKRQQFIDLIVGAVVKSPGFKNPSAMESQTDE